MRQFLYYNDDSINSFLAQIEQGLLTRNEFEKKEEGTTSTTQEKQSNITGALSAKVLGIGAAIQTDIKGSDSDTEIATQMVRSVQEKALHDFAFDRIYEHLIQNKIINNEKPSIGDVIVTEGTHTFLDFNYFQALFADNGAYKFVNDQARKQMDEKLRELRKSFPKGQAMPEEIKKQLAELENKIKSVEPQRKEILKTIEVIRTTLPYNRFIMISNFLVPLTDKYLRDDPDIIAFKYGGALSVLGYVTNVISDGEQGGPTNEFAAMYDAVNKVMLSLFQGQKKIFIVHPIALYYYQHT